MSKSIAIIGGGIAGLSSGIYALLNGYKAEIFEMHSIAGGLCTSWKRKDYIFDGCIHWLTGSSPASTYYKLWADIGGVQNKEFFNYDYLSKIMDENGIIRTLYTDPQKLKQELLAISPEDKKPIEELIRDIEKFKRHEMPPDMNFSSLVKFLPLISSFYKYRISVKELAEKFKSPELKRLFAQSLDWHGMPSAFILWSIGLMASGNGGYPMGGSSAFIRSVVERFEKLGGLIHYNSKTEKILVRDNKAVGLRLTDGREIGADIVISAADGHSTIFEMLEGKYINKKIERLYSELEPFPPLLYVSLGINADYSNEPISLTFPLKVPFRVGQDEIRTLSFKNYTYDKVLCPQGKSIFIVMLPASYEYWQELRKVKDSYEAEKKRVRENVISSLEQIYPGIGNQVEVADVATPMTFIRYTGNWKGSYQGWLLTKSNMTKQVPQDSSRSFRLLYGRTLDLARRWITIRSHHRTFGHQNDL